MITAMFSYDISQRYYLFIDEIPHTWYILYSWLIYFAAGGLYVLIVLTYFLLVTTCLFSVSLTLFLFCYVCSFIEIIQLLSFSDWRISLSIMPSRSIHVVANSKIPFFFIAMEKAVAPHSSTLAWKIPWTEEPGRLQSMGSHRVGHDWSDLAAVFRCMYVLHLPYPFICW